MIFNSSFLSYLTFILLFFICYCFVTEVFMSKIKSIKLMLLLLLRCPLYGMEVKMGFREPVTECPFPLNRGSRLDYVNIFLGL